jgi:hypothetical protein
VSGAARARSRRLARELKTVRAMIALACGRRHGGGRALCPDCEALWAYAQARVDHCPFQECKPTCANCTVHCYMPSMRERIRDVMRYAGPRMMWRHPVLTIHHILRGRQEPPELKRRRAASGDPGAG